MSIPRVLQSTDGNCRYHGQKAGLFGRILRSPARSTLSTALILTAVTVTGCAAPLPTATPTPTPTPTPPPVVEEALEELFWISVDWVGEVSQTPGINRTLDFETAKSAVKDFLFKLYIENFNTLEEYGVPPYETFPYCFDLTSGTYHLAALIRASSPAEAAPHVDETIGTIHRVAMDISLIEGGGAGIHDKQLCDQFEDEKREALGLPPLNGQ